MLRSKAVPVLQSSTLSPLPNPSSGSVGRAKDNEGVFVTSGPGALCRPGARVPSGSWSATSWLVSLVTWRWSTGFPAAASISKEQLRLRLVGGPGDRFRADEALHVVDLVGVRPARQQRAHLRVPSRAGGAELRARRHAEGLDQTPLRVAPSPVPVGRQYPGR
ncbi:hypothetical protein [Streptomyces narbonensis]|uniref:hypothetical protein n=1 Tax=Streptomyces narbonensis TaxID=67333 RepID=UPI001679ED51|nr:hypothetical protein [Streptomyces narbonensis]